MKEADDITADQMDSPHQDDEGQQKAILAALGLGLLRLSDKGTVLWMNDQARSLLSNALVPIHLPDGSKGMRLLTSGRGGKQPWEEVLQQRGKTGALAFEVHDTDGRLMPVLFEGTCEPDAHGGTQVVMSVRRNLEPPSTEDTYRALFEAVNDGIVVLDIETGAVVDNNRRAVEMYRYGEHDAPPRAAHETTSRPASEADAEAFAWMLRAARGKPQVFEWQAVDAEGREVILEVSLKRARLGGSTVL